VLPRLDPEKHLVLLEDILMDFVRLNEYEPVVMQDEDEARRSVADLRQIGKWPVFLSPLDTVGEKPYEEFVGHNEEVKDIGLEALEAVSYVPAAPGAVIAVRNRLRSIRNCCLNEPLTKDTFKQMIGSIEPAFLSKHRDTGQLLDERM
jgi:hypothetical protein